MRSVGTSAKNMLGKTTGAVTGVFRRDKTAPDTLAAKSDPLRLDNKPDQVDPEVFVANGQLWESTGDQAKAMESYTRALEGNPKYAPALTSLARLHFRQGNLPQAVTYFERALVEKPQDAGLHNDLGLTLSKLGKQPAAVASLEKALQLAPGTSRYANNLASVRFESGDSKAALMVLMQNNKPAVAHFNMAYLHFKKGQMPQAQGHLSEAMKFEPQAGGDAATGRAIQRSRDMLVQIQSVQGQRWTPGVVPVPGMTPGYAPIAQATPSATTVGGSMPGAPSYTAPVQQTSQLSPTTTGVARVSSPGARSGTRSMGPAMSAITVPKSPTSTIVANTPTHGPMAATAPAIQTASTTATRKWDSWNRAAGDSGNPSATSPIRPSSAPASSTPASSTPASSATPASAIESAQPANSFSLPQGFSFPASK